MKNSIYLCYYLSVYLSNLYIYIYFIPTRWRNIHSNRYFSIYLPRFFPSLPPLSPPSSFPPSSLSPSFLPSLLSLTLPPSLPSLSLAFVKHIQITRESFTYPLKERKLKDKIFTYILIVFPTSLWELKLLHVKFNYSLSQNGIEKKSYSNQPILYLH